MTRPADMRSNSTATRVRQLVDALSVYEPERVYLFGSAAFDEADEVSDLDVVVIKQTEASFFDRLSEVAGLLPGGMGAIDILVYTPAEFEAMQQEGNAFAEMVVEEGRLIYGEPAHR